MSLVFKDHGRLRQCLKKCELSTGPIKTVSGCLFQIAIILQREWENFQHHKQHTILCFYISANVLSFPFLLSLIALKILNLFVNCSKAVAFSCDDLLSLFLQFKISILLFLLDSVMKV